MNASKFSKHVRAAHPFQILALLCACAATLTAQLITPPDFQPKYPVRLEASVMVPMRDGVKLSTDLYIPEGAGEKLPVIVMRTPYDKSATTNWNFRSKKSVAYFFAGQGYVVAVQDTRGRFESDGEYTVSASDSNDGYDTVSWAATQPWSDGKVATYGCSYLGEDQIEAAKLRNPHLTAMIPQSDGGSDRYFGIINGGVIELAAGFGWFRGAGSKVFAKLPSQLSHAQFVDSVKYFNLAPVLPSIDYEASWKSLPLIDMVKKAGAPPTDWEDFVSHEPADPWWEKFGYVKKTDHFDAPALSVGSWYDIDVGDALNIYGLLSKNGDSARARENQFIIISPTAHCLSELATEHTIVGKRDLGDARFDYYGTYLRWFDHWLKGIDNGVTKMPKVQVYVMGKNQWRGENEWPLARTQFTRYYFHSNGNANSRVGDGTLSTQAPGNETPDHFVYDPASPVRTLGGPICCTGAADASPGAFDQSDIEMRSDVLVYTTPAFQQGIEVTGPLQVVLYVSSSARDTDFTAKLVDVYPDSTAYNVQDGIQRSRYREGYEKKTWMAPGEVYEVKIDLQVTSNYFGPGHRIRVEISSSNFPRFDRNLNTGGNNYDEVKWAVANNTVHHSGVHASYILLPVIP